MLLEDKVAIITGAAQGIGRAISELFSSEGALSVLCDIQGEEVKKIADEIFRKTRKKTQSFKVDVKKKSEIQKVVDEVEKEYGHIDILVNNAGIMKLAPFLSMEEDVWDEVFAVNVKGAFLFSQLVARVMLKNKSGKIINISSDSGLRPEKKECAYCSSKSALIGLTRVMALELGPYGIYCNAICPGATDTPLLRTHYMKTEEDRQRFIEATALKKIAEPKDIANVALFLASHLSDHITGEYILVTAGDPMSQ
jgi:NAD(P)-dependent dehydrogenase (short-subunit alcohol dehydrogenase family)